MNAYDLFEFQDYLSEFDLKKVEYIFSNQCLQKDFKEFHTSLGSNSKDYLSYLTAFSFIDGTIDNNKEGHKQFLTIANGFSERFFQMTIYHCYNLSILNNKEELFRGLIDTSKDILKSWKGNLCDFKQVQFKDYLENIVTEMNLNPNFYDLHNYQKYHQKMQSYVLQEKLKNELPITGSENKKPKL